jgi:hypothetical protein
MSEIVGVAFPVPKKYMQRFFRLTALLVVSAVSTPGML